MKERLQLINSYLKKEFEKLIPGSTVQAAWGMPDTIIHIVQQNNNIVTEMELTVSLVSDDFRALGRTINLEDEQKNEFTLFSSDLVQSIKHHLSEFSRTFLASELEVQSKTEKLEKLVDEHEEEWEEEFDKTSTKETDNAQILNE